MADSQATPTIELQTPPNWVGSLAEAPAGQREQIAGAADEARRHVEEGFTTDDLRNELKRSKRSRAWKRFGIVLGVLVALIAAAAVAVVLYFLLRRLPDRRTRWSAVLMTACGICVICDVFFTLRAWKADGFYGMISGTQTGFLTLMTISSKHGGLYGLPDAGCKGTERAPRTAQ